MEGVLQESSLPFSLDFRKHLGNSIVRVSQMALVLRKLCVQVVLDFEDICSVDN